VSWPHGLEAATSSLPQGQRRDSCLIRTDNTMFFNSPVAHKRQHEEKEKKIDKEEAGAQIKA
jgi:hypothetical protein